MAFEDDIRRIVREELSTALADIRVALRAPVPSSTGTLLTVDQVAERAGHVSAETVRGWIRSGQLVARKAGHRFVVRPEDLERFLAQETAACETIDSDRHLELVMSRVKRAAGGK